MTDSRLKDESAICFFEEIGKISRQSIVKNGIIYRQYNNTEERKCMMKKDIIKLMILLMVTIFMINILPVCSYSVWADGEYKLIVNRSKNLVTVYQKGDKGKYDMPFKVMACSTAKDVASTPLGKFTLSQKKEWRENKDKTFSQYAYKITDFVWFVGAVYKSESAGDMITSSYNLLGESGATGNDCIMLSVADAKWIYDNCKEGTAVEILVKDDAGAILGDPMIMDIPENHKNAKWDPTDPNTRNPWLNEKPVIYGVNDITRTAGDEIDLMEGVTATDICGNDITSKVIVTGGGDFSQPGEYLVNYYVTDITGANASIDIMVKIVKEGEKVEVPQKETTHKNSTGNSANSNNNIGNSTATTSAKIFEEEEDGSLGTVLIVAVVAFVISTVITKWSSR